MKIVFSVLVTLFLFISPVFCADWYSKFAWDAPTTGRLPVDGYRVGVQNCDSGHVRYYETSKCEYLIADMSLEDNMAYDLWVQSFIGSGNTMIKSDRSNIVRYDTRMPWPIQQIEIVEKLPVEHIPELEGEI